MNPILSVSASHKIVLQAVAGNDEFGGLSDEITHNNTLLQRDGFANKGRRIADCHIAVSR